jgi:hypothetical protein
MKKCFSQILGGSSWSSSLPGTPAAVDWIQNRYKSVEGLRLIDALMAMQNISSS